MRRYYAIRHSCPVLDTGQVLEPKSRNLSLELRSDT